MKISCYSCAQKLDVSSVAAFTKIQCPKCEAKIIVPKIFGDILLEQDLGNGSIAKVYRSLDTTLDREAAVKVLLEEYLENDELKERFIKEAQKASTINHPHVIPIYSCGDVKGKVYISMQFMQINDILKYVKRKDYDQHMITDWFMRIASALDAAVDKGIHHHNIKPSCLFLDADRNIKIGDFGLSRIMDRDKALLIEDRATESITFDDSLYVAPELVNSGKFDISCDIYSLGATFYHLYTGMPPFNGMDATDNLKSRLSEKAPEAIKYRDDLKPEINDLLNRMLSIYSSERPKNFGEIYQILEDLHRSSRKSSKPKSKAKRPSNAIKKQRNDTSLASKPVKKMSVANTQANVQYNSRSRSLQTILQVIPVVLIMVLILLILSHILHLSWYEKSVRPLLPGYEAASEQEEKTEEKSEQAKQQK